MTINQTRTAVDLYGVYVEDAEGMKNLLFCVAVGLATLFADKLDDVLSVSIPGTFVFGVFDVVIHHALYNMVLFGIHMFPSEQAKRSDAPIQGI